MEGTTAVYTLLLAAFAVCALLVIFVRTGELVTKEKVKHAG